MITTTAVNFFNRLSRIGYKIAYKIILLIWFFTRPTVKGVYVAVWYDQKILVIKNSYKKRYTLPCGRLKKNEDPLDAAVRELYEEVNIKLDASQLLFVGKYIGRYTYATDEGHFFEIKMAQRPAVQADDREVIWARFLSVEDTMQLKLNPAVRSYLNDRY